MVLDFAAQYPDRIASLALFEPGVHDRDHWSPEEQAAYATLLNPALSPNQLLPVMMQLLIPPGVSLPPDRPSPPPERLAKVAAGLKAMLDSIREYRIDLDQFRQFHQPVYLAFGSLSPPFISWRPAERLAKVFPNIRIEVYEGRHHLDVLTESQRFAHALRTLWAKSESV